jgi:hypothetical protein
MAGKKPPAPTMSARPDGLTRKISEHARVRDTNRMIGPRNDYVAIDGQTLCWSHLQGDTHGTAKWHGSLQTVRAQPPNSGMADTLEEAKARFKRRYAEANGRK